MEGAKNFSTNFRSEMGSGGRAVCEELLLVWFAACRGRSSLECSCILGASRPTDGSREPRCPCSPKDDVCVCSFGRLSINNESVVCTICRGTANLVRARLAKHGRSANPN